MNAAQKMNRRIRVEPKGLGDTLANLTFITGIDMAVKKVTNALNITDCGCTKRQEKLNEFFPYKK